MPFVLRPSSIYPFASFSQHSSSISSLSQYPPALSITLSEKHIPTGESVVRPNKRGSTGRSSPSRKQRFGFSPISHAQYASKKGGSQAVFAAGILLQGSSFTSHSKSHSKSHTDPTAESYPSAITSNTEAERIWLEQQD